MRYARETSPIAMFEINELVSEREDPQTKILIHRSEKVWDSERRVWNGITLGRPTACSLGEGRFRSSSVSNSAAHRFISYPEVGISEANQGGAVEVFRIIIPCVMVSYRNYGRRIEPVSPVLDLK